tara:strand:+ start:554 stop:1267 length:714 start_codon:yes stop_codon:yes gene_type:complete
MRIFGIILLFFDRVSVLYSLRFSKGFAHKPNTNFLVKKPTQYLPFYKINPFVRENLPWDIYDQKCTSSNWSTEHVIPRSLLKINRDSENNTILDLYNLFNTSPHINSHRSNYKFSPRAPISKKTFQVSNSNTQIAEIIDTYRFNYKNNKLKLWIPVENSRGPISRAIAYMYFTYNLQNIETVINFDILKRWNSNYPPPPWEIEHMWKIFNIQGNINPFIIYPQYLNNVNNDLLHDVL